MIQRDDRRRLRQPIALDHIADPVPQLMGILDKEFGRSGNATAPSPFPQVRLVAVGECGTHGIVDAAFGPVTTGEQSFAERLIARFTPDMLVLADRNFYSYDLWCQAVNTGAALLWRVSASVSLPLRIYSDLADVRVGMGKVPLTWENEGA
jgi:hypothetical protein